MAKPFKGEFFYEWQIGTFVFQIRRRDNKHKMGFPIKVWRDRLG